MAAEDYLFYIKCTLSQHSNWAAPVSCETIQLLVTPSKARWKPTGSKWALLKKRVNDTAECCHVGGKLSILYCCPIFVSKRERQHFLIPVKLNVGERNEVWLPITVQAITKACEEKYDTGRPELKVEQRLKKQRMRLFYGWCSKFI